MKKISAVLLIIFMAWGCNHPENNLKKIIQQRVFESTINLIPDSVGVTPSYCCTWSCQNFATDTFSIGYAIGLGDHTVPADNLTEEAVFNKPGWEKRLPQSVKKDLFLVFDVGWDISGGSHVEKEKKWILGTQEVATDKFPSCTPAFIVPPDQNYDPLQSRNQMDAVTRAVHWQRLKTMAHPSEFQVSY